MDFQGYNRFMDFVEFMGFVDFMVNEHVDFFGVSKFMGFRIC